MLGIENRVVSKHPGDILKHNAYARNWERGSSYTSWWYSRTQTLMLENENGVVSKHAGDIWSINVDVWKGEQGSM